MAKKPVATAASIREVPAPPGSGGRASDERGHAAAAAAAPRPMVQSTPTPPEEPYVLLPSDAEVRIKDLADVRNRIEDFVRLKCLTPVLGSETTDAVTLPDQAILRDLKYLTLLEAQRPGDDRLRTFYESLTKDRRNGRPLLDTPVEARPVDCELARLRVALTDAAWQATVLYATSWSQSASPVFDWQLHRAAGAGQAGGGSPPEEPSSALLVAALNNAITAIDGFRVEQSAHEATDHRGALLGAQGLKLRLEHLLNDLKKPDYVLMGTTVEWLTDVLWHALMFDSPCYPTREELALQISLGVERRDPIHRVEITALTPGGVNQRWGRYREAMSRPLASLRGRDGAPTKPGALHLALAESLFQSYGRWTPPGTPLMRRRRHPPLPLGITLTTDVELERALATRGEPQPDDVPASEKALNSLLSGVPYYHVAFPMILTADGQENLGYLRWVVGKFKACLAVDDPHLWSKLTKPEEPWRLLNDVAGENQPLGKGTGGLEGPLLLKASGSPLHEVRESLDNAENTHLADGFAAELGAGSADALDGQEARRCGRVRHVPATTELEVLQLTQVDQWAMGAFNGRAGLPPQIRTSLVEEDRRWLLLGPDLQEWSSRLQLFTQISLSMSGKSRSPRHDTTLAIVRKADDVRMRLLLGLGFALTDYATIRPPDIAESIHAAVAMSTTNESEELKQ